MNRKRWFLRLSPAQKELMGSIKKEDVYTLGSSSVLSNTPNLRLLQKAFKDVKIMED